jgi:uncharacterized RDD family membrane protein YckC
MDTVTRVRSLVTAAVATMTVCVPMAGAAQPSPSSPPAEATAPDVERATDTRAAPQYGQREIFRFDQDYQLGSGDAIGEAVVIAGDATIEGRVARDVVVILGTLHLAGTAAIDGSLIVVGGNAVVMPGAVVRSDVIVVGGAIDAPTDFTAGGEHIVIGPRTLGGRLEVVAPWVTRGLLWGRLIVPDLPWVWAIVLIAFLVYLAITVVFERAVGDCAERLAERPLTSFLTGLLVLLLTGPLCMLLVVTVIGIAVVPLVLCALVAAWIVGKVGVARWLGGSVVRQESRDSRSQSIRSFAIGFALIIVAYMVPVLSLIAWMLVGVLGLGASALAFIVAYRRESPAPVPRGREAPTTPAPQYQQGEPVPPETSASIPMNSSASTARPPFSDLALYPHARFLDRLAAFVLDVILVLIAERLLNPIWHDDRFLVLLLAYHVGFWTWKGTTVGGIICQLRLVRVDGAPLRFVDALVRGLSSIFSLAVLGLGGLWILKDAERQAWHDKIAGTYVVKVPRNFALS